MEPTETANSAPSALRVEREREPDGRWLARVPELPGVMTYGASEDAAVRAVMALALEVVADRLQHGEAVPEVILRAFALAA